MFRNQYNSEVTLYSPEGRLLQIEYAKIAAGRGKALVGIRSSVHLVFLSLDKEIKNLPKTPNKVFVVNSGILIGASGVTNDGKIIYNLLKQEIKKNQSSDNSIIPICHLCTIVFCFFHINTVYFGTRPFGVNFLIGGYDKRGLFLFKIVQDMFYGIKLKADIGEIRKNENKVFNLFSNDFPSYSIAELLHCTIEYAIKNNIGNEKNQNLLEEKINISTTGKNLKATVFNFKLNKFFIRCFFKAKI